MEGDQGARPGPRRQPGTLHHPGDLRCARRGAAPEQRTKGRASGRPCCAPRSLLSLRCPPAGLPGPRGFLPGTAALTAPARPAFAGRRQRSCRGRSAAKPPPQLGPSTRALAPPIVKRTGRRLAVQSQRRGTGRPALPIRSRDTAGSRRAIQSAAGPSQVRVRLHSPRLVSGRLALQPGLSVGARGLLTCRESPIRPGCGQRAARVWPAVSLPRGCSPGPPNPNTNPSKWALALTSP